KSSSQRRQIFLDIQTAAGVKQPVHLIKDMPVRWSSTNNMIKRAYENREHIVQLITELERAEKDWKKRGALSALHLSEDEWAQLKLLLELLELPDCAQQAFSAETYSTLYNAMPALLGLLHAWESLRDSDRYLDLHAPLRRGIDKLREYVDDIRASPNDAYHVAMVLNPAIKFGPAFDACWSDPEQRREAVKELFRTRYERLHATPTDAPPTGAASTTSAFRSLLAHLTPSNPSPTSAPATEAWRVEYESYLRSDHDIPDGMSLVQWWGINSTRFPTWAALATDYLAAMAGSVSSERIFSSAGITITKRRNRLQSDIVEATQVLKAALRNDLLVRSAPPSSTLE
ncbi:hypothetical protein AURDEDRAFT_40006, partial [Auricularia subglabra TFB-10046 SS5]